MKKHIVAILSVIAVLGSLTACNASFEVQPGNQSSADYNSTTQRLKDTPTDLGSDDSEDSYPGSGNIETQSNSVEQVTGIYGETDIPDLPCGNIDFEGKASSMLDRDTLDQSLYGMVFETHIFGDYTVNLVGYGVRTDKTNFPDSIYAQYLRVEVEKNGEKIGEARYNSTVLYGSQFQTEYRLLTDRIGNYLSVYRMENPVIAMRYYFDDDPKRTVTKAVEFTVIQNGEVWDSFVGVCSKDTGILFNPNLDVNDPYTMLALNSEEGWKCRVSVFAADEFKIVDDKTLVDEELGIKYTFNFSDPPQMELYTTETII